MILIPVGFLAGVAILALILFSLVRLIMWLDTNEEITLEREGTDALPPPGA